VANQSTAHRNPGVYTWAFLAVNSFVFLIIHFFILAKNAAKPAEELKAGRK
jgi:hypothetical protein